MLPLRRRDRTAPAALAPVLVLALGLGGASAGTACRAKPTGESTGAVVDAAPPPSFDDPPSGSRPAEELAYSDAGRRFRDAEPKVDRDPDGPIDPMCSGAEIAFAVAIVDRRCAIGGARAKQLRAALEPDGGSPVGGRSRLTLRQEASVAADGRIVLRLVNTGAAALTLPLSFSSKVPAFTVLAEDGRHTIYELEAPRFDVGAPGSPVATAANERPHFSRIVVAPGGAAVATIAIAAGVVRVLARGAGTENCPEGGACTPARLVKGRYVLHVGQLLTDVETGAPARVTFDLP